MTSEIKDLGEKTMFMAVNDPAWHNLGNVVQGAKTWKEAIKLANMQWLVEKKQLAVYQGPKVDAWGTFRVDTKQFLGSVGSDYTIIQNEEVFEFLDGLMGAEGGVHYETAGALNDGQRVFCLAKVPHDFVIKGTDDVHRTYLLAAASHNGSLKLTGMLTETRVVCSNTLSIALSGKGLKGAIEVRHTKNAQQRIKKIIELQKDILITTQKIHEKLDVLAQRKMTTANLQEVVRRLFPAKEGKEITKQAERKLEQISALYEYNDNNAFPQIRGTAYNFLNACTEFSDHYLKMVDSKNRAGVDDKITRADLALFGGGMMFKNRALDILLELTKGAPYNDLSKIISIPSAPVEEVVEPIEWPDEFDTKESK